MIYNNRMKIIFFILLAIFFSGCVNDRGISMRFYNDCVEYYDAQGFYRKKCDENIVDFADVKKALQTKPNPKFGSVE